MVDYQAHLADTYSNLGNTLRALDRKDEALAFYRKSCAGYEPLVARQPSTTRYRTNLALAYTNMGYLLDEAERLEEAMAAYEKALALRQGLLATNPRVPRFQADVAQSHFYIGKTHTRIGFPRSRSLFCGALATAPANPLTALVCLHLPPDDTDYHYSEGALEEYDKALAIQTRLVEGTGLGEVTPAVAAGLVGCGTGSALGVAASLHRQTNSLTFVDYRADLGRTHIQIANVHRDGKKLFDAFSWNKKAVDTWKQVLDEVPAEDEFRSNLAISHSNFEVTLQDLRLALAARSAHEKGRVLREKLVADHPEDRNYRQQLAESYNSLGIATLSLRRRDQGLDWFRKAAAGFRHLVGKYPEDSKLRSDLARAILNEGITFIEMGKPQEALPYLLRSLPMQRQAMEQKPRRYRFRELVGKTYGQLAIAHAALGRVADAEAALAERRRLWGLEAEPLVQMAVDLGKCVTLVGDGKEKLTEAEEAARRKYADLAMDVLREAVALGFRDVERLGRETKLEPLRERPDFQELLKAAADR